MKKVQKTTRPFRYSVQFSLSVVSDSLRPHEPFRYDLNQISYNYAVEVRNRFKGLYLIDRVPGKLWMKVCDIVQEAVIKNTPKKKKCKKAKWFSEEVLQIAEKRRDAKGKGKKERYTHLNTDFQRIAKR